jgi:hypothetical protein
MRSGTPGGRGDDVRRSSMTIFTLSRRLGARYFIGSDDDSRSHVGECAPIPRQTS